MIIIGILSILIDIFDICVDVIYMSRYLCVLSGLK